MTAEAFESILAAARTGADWAWARLYHEYAAPVRGYLRMRGAAEPDDLLGEVFLQLARNLATFEGTEQAFRSWVFTVAHNRVIDERRYRSRRPVEPVAEPESPAAAGNVETEAIDDLTTERLIADLDALSPDQRDVLLLRLVGDLTIDQIATAIGKRRGAVKALQRRGLEALRRNAERKGVPL